jgi:hypothetical protein
MSRARHHTAKKHHGKHHADGGEAEVGNPKVFAEAKKHTEGKIEGGHAKKHLGRKHGGKCHASGGKAGADTHPYSSARKHGGKAEHHEGHSHHHGLHGAEKHHKKD